MLLDVIMPGMNGHQVLRQLKACPASREIRVIMISAVDEVESVVRGIELGADDYLLKPFNPVILGTMSAPVLRRNVCVTRRPTTAKKSSARGAAPTDWLQAILPPSAVAELKGDHNEVKPRRLE